MNLKDKVFLTADELRKLLRISPNKFRQLVKNGMLPKPFPFGPRSKRWTKESVEAWVKNHGGAA